MWIARFKHLQVEERLIEIFLSRSPITRAHIPKSRSIKLLLPFASSASPTLSWLTRRT